MNILPYFFVSLITVFIVNLVMWLLFKDVEKKDKGFVLGYYRLSYRRRFIRSLWGIPFALLVYLALFWLVDLTSIEYILVGAIFLLLIFVDSSYNYIKWKKNGRNS
ncbi:hypothetical protein SAMN05880501_1236 [Ureibacillus xyleni]|uniref:Uncharacterized protein n=1 Tax=Ureibacillus xyleni TaxID=614648 RepID=A0A285TU37_9BACL|nr:hypothetical protein [Ureibacillus xyleni]SOC27530.1 hypothetical protein SAMN05880501_1236 [Ureibacillus xyleni]